MADDDGEARGTDFLKRKSMFSWSRTPADPLDPNEQVVFVMPSGIVREQEARLSDGELLPELCKLLGVRDHDRVAEKIRALSAQQGAAQHVHGLAASVSVRRKRMSKLLRTITTAAGDAGEVLQQAARDDDGFFRSETGRAILGYVNAAIRAAECLEKELAQLKPPSQGDNARVADPPIQAFLVYAELLWWEETFVQPHKRAEHYQRYLELLWEILTGDKDRSFAKAKRRRRTRHRD